MRRRGKLVNLPICVLPGLAPGFATFCGIANSNGSVTLEFLYVAFLSPIFTFGYDNVDMVCLVIDLVSVVTS